MKKIFLLSLALVCMMSLISSPILAEEAEQIEKVCVIGTSKIEASPDTAEISIGVQKRTETIEEGQTAISSLVENVKNAILAVDSEASLSISYSSVYPVCEHGIQAFEFNYNYTIKTKALDKISEIVKAAGNAGAVRFSQPRFCIENEEELYYNALSQAKQNASQKANAIANGLTLKAVFEQSVYSYCSPRNDDKIIIEASIKAIFEKNESQENLAFNYSSSSSLSSFGSGLAFPSIRKEENLE